MGELVDWVLMLTKSKMLTWHKVGEDVNEHLESQRLKNAFMVAHSSPCVRRKFGGAYIGFRGKRKILCAAIVDGSGNWYYIDAKKEESISVKKFFSLVKKMATKKEKCRKCKKLGWI
jgi:hypothetical protein